MRLVGILNWYNEKPAWLAATVASMGHAGCEHLIAVDGAYAAYPNGRSSSSALEHEVIRETALAQGMGCTLFIPTEVWPGNEVEKRSFGFRLAETLTDEEDWVFLMDADMVITTSIGLREELEMSTLDFGEVELWERPYGGSSPVRCLFRALRGLRLEGNHYTYATDDGIVCTTGRTLGPRLPHDLSFVRIEHREHERDPARRREREDYYERRGRLELEVAV